MKPHVVTRDNPKTHPTLPAVPRKLEIPTRTLYDESVIREAEESPEGFFTSTYKVSGAKYSTERSSTLEEAKAAAEKVAPYVPGGRHVMVYAVSGSKQVYVGSHVPGEGWRERQK